MKFNPPLKQATLIKRSKRFLADVSLADGTQTTLHCPNTGSMKNCLYPGRRIWYSESDNPKRKYPCTWELADIPVIWKNQSGTEERSELAGLNTGYANKLVAEALSEQRIPELSAYQSIRREICYGEENSRIDFLLQQHELPDCFIEVKSVTMAVGNGLGLFPDAVTTRGAKHLRELIRVKEQGRRAILFFCVQHTGIQTVSVAKNIDPQYARQLRAAIDVGVEVLAWGADISTEAISLERSLPIDL